MIAQDLHVEKRGSAEDAFSLPSGEEKAPALVRYL
jgi:hypothetical protein